LRLFEAGILDIEKLEAHRRGLFQRGVQLRRYQAQAGRHFAGAIHAAQIVREVAEIELADF
jgi:hypothetical protein